MHQKKGNAETLCKIWFVPFVSLLPSSMTNSAFLSKCVFCYYVISYFMHSNIDGYI